MSARSISTYNFFIAGTVIVGLCAITAVVYSIIGLASTDILSFNQSLAILVPCTTIAVLAGFILKTFHQKKKERDAIIKQQRKPLSVEAMTSVHIKSRDEISKLTQINGLSIKDIEKRARPAILDKLKETSPDDPDPELCRSMSGFLGENDRLQEILLVDWETTRRLGWNHNELAQSLAEIAGKAKPLSPHDSHIIEYNGQKLEVTHGQHKGEQHCLFDLHQPWNGYCHIRHLKTHAHVQWTPGVQLYIRDFGFYEGGIDNEHRVDPIHLISIITGESIYSLRKRRDRIPWS